MADPTLTQKFTVLLGDGGTPTENFGWPCGATARSVTFTNNTGEDVVLDCDDPTGTMAAIQRFVESQDTSLSISGKVAKTSLATWRAWADDADKKNVRAVVDEALADNGGYWEFPAILQEFEISQENNATAAFTATIVGAGRRTWTDAPA